MSITIYLANKGFSLPVGRLDSARRKAYFLNPADPKNQLLPEELAILISLGIDVNKATALRPYLAQFFDQLPACQSDSSVILSKECEVVHHVLWTTLFNARTRSKTAYDLNWKTKKPLADLSVAINDSVLKDLQPKREDVNDIDRLFTLLLKSARTPATTAATAAAATAAAAAAAAKAKATAPFVDATSLFTLILPDWVPEEPTEPPSSPAAVSPPGSEPGVLEEIDEAKTPNESITGPSTLSSVSMPSADGLIRKPLAKNLITEVPTGINVREANKQSWFTRKRSPLGQKGTQINLGATPAPNKPSWFTRKFGKKPTTQQGTQINLGGPKYEEPSDNRQGESPFTKQTTEVNLGITPAGVLSAVPDEADIANQCEGQPEPTQQETHLEEFKRSCYFFHSIKNQELINLQRSSLDQPVEDKFLTDWQKAIKGKSDKIQASLTFLGVPAEKLRAMDDLYATFINGGTDSRPHPIAAYGCTKRGEQVAGYMERFIPVVQKAPRERLYQFEHGDWVAGGGSPLDQKTPRTVDAIDIAIRDTDEFLRYEASEIRELSIVTTRDINYAENAVFNYGIQGKHIHELTLAHDLFAKNKSYVVDISARLMYLLNKEKDILRPTAKGPQSIQQHFLGTAFRGNYVPPVLSADPLNQEQVNVAFYEICHILASNKSNPASFYSKPLADKLPVIVKELSKASDAEYKLITDSIQWAVPEKKPITKQALLDMFLSVAKKPQSFFNRMFTRKNKTNKFRNVTRKNQAAEVGEAAVSGQWSGTVTPKIQPPIALGPAPNTQKTLPINVARAQRAQQRLLLEAPELPIRDKKGISNDNMKAILVKAKQQENQEKERKTQAEKDVKAFVDAKAERDRRFAKEFDISESEYQDAWRKALMRASRFPDFLEKTVLEKDRYVRLLTHKLIEKKKKENAALLAELEELNKSSSDESTLVSGFRQKVKTVPRLPARSVATE